MADPGEFPSTHAAAPIAGADYQSLEQWPPGYLIAALVLIVGVVGGIRFHGPLAEFMVAGLEVVPFALLALLAYLGVARAWAQILSFAWLLTLLLGMSVVAFALTFATAGQQPPTRLVADLFWDTAGLAAAFACLAPGVRRWAAGWLPIDPGSSVHTVALSLVSGAIVIGLGQLVATGGHPALLELLRADPAMAERAKQSQLLSVIYTLIWMVPGALLAVGYPVVRTPGAAIRRLGLARPTLRQVCGAVGLGILLVVVAGKLLNPGIDWLWQRLHWPQTDEKAFEQLLGSLITPAGAVAIAVSAGIGEELVVRGALQPRLGILLSNLFFTSLHAPQYGFDALLSVFVVGSVLGIVRARSNTTIAIIAHGVYDFCLVMLGSTTR
jgi:hypothetical protein